MPDNRWNSLNRRLKKLEGQNQVDISNIMSKYPNKPRTKPFFNPKAKIDETQVEDRTPQLEDFRNMLMSRAKTSFYVGPPKNRRKK